jgi:hypothetical protein
MEFLGVTHIFEVDARFRATLSLEGPLQVGR